ncbi:MAG: ABC transporter ATP-binding protein [Thermoplasmata archaeon]
MNIERAAVEARRLCKVYDGLVAVDGIDFKIEKGEIFGFLGPNGAGKTTTVKMIYCASPRSSGELYVNGLDVNKEPRKVKAMIGVVPQENNLDPDFTVYENLIIFSRYFDIPKKVAENRANDLINFMNLEEKKDVRVDGLSGGMKRRLIIARALINEPEILILDEPTTGLDPQARHMIWERIRGLKSKGTTIILTTHYMEEAEYLCDRVVVMDKGKILVEGTPRELISKYVKREVIEVSDVSGRLKKEIENLISSNIAFSSVEIDSCAERIFLYTDNADSLFKFLSEKISLPETLIRRSTLEDVFLKLTGRRLRE